MGEGEKRRNEKSVRIESEEMEGEILLPRIRSPKRKAEEKKKKSQKERFLEDPIEISNLRSPEEDEDPNSQISKRSMNLVEREMLPREG